MSDCVYATYSQAFLQARDALAARNPAALEGVGAGLADLPRQEREAAQVAWNDAVSRRPMLGREHFCRIHRTWIRHEECGRLRGQGGAPPDARCAFAQGH